MFARFRAHFRQQFVGYIALLLILTGGTAYAANEWTGANIVDESLTSADIQNQQVKVNDLAIGSVWGSRIRDDGIVSSQVVDQSLRDEDIGQTKVRFEQTVGNVPAGQCVTKENITSVDARGNHLILTPDFGTTATDLTYSVNYRDNLSKPVLVVCNPRTHDIDDGSTKFNLLVIDAQ